MPIIEVADHVAPVSWQASWCDADDQMSADGQPLLCLDKSISMGHDSSDEERNDGDGAAMNALIQQASLQSQGGHACNLIYVAIHSLDCQLNDSCSCLYHVQPSPPFNSLLSYYGFRSCLAL